MIRPCVLAIVWAGLLWQEIGSLAASCYPQPLKQWSALNITNYSDIPEETISLTDSNFMISGYVSDDGNIPDGICNQRPYYSVFLTIQKAPLPSKITLGTRYDPVSQNTYIDMVYVDVFGVTTDAQGIEVVNSRKFFFSVRRRC